MNLYDLVNAELGRMYEERDLWMKMVLAFPKRDGREPNDPNLPYARERFKSVDDAIINVRKNILAQIESYDQKIQEKIAELALTGKSDG